MHSKTEDIFYVAIKVCEYKYNNNLDFLLVDEAQFLTAKQVEELANIVKNLNITVICYGLKTDFRTYFFEGSKRLFELSDKTREIERQCSCDRRNKTVNMRLEKGIPVFEGNQIMIDGVEAK